MQFLRPFLVKVAFMETVDNFAMACLVNDTLRAMATNLDVDRVRMLLSDTGPYVLNWGEQTPDFFPVLASSDLLPV